MTGLRIPGSVGQEGRPADDVRDGTLGAFANRAPGTVGSQRATDADFLGRLRSGLTWLDMQPVVVKALGPASFSAGVVYGMGEDVVTSVVEFADLVKTFVLADVYDRVWGGPPVVAGMSLAFADPARALVAAAGGAWLRDEAKEAREQRDALIEALRYAFANPGEFFEGLKDEYVEKWDKFERCNAQTSVAARFEAGRLFGEILIAVLGLAATGAGLAKLGAKFAGRFARLGRRLERAAAGLRRKTGPVQESPSSEIPKPAARESAQTRLTGEKMPERPPLKPTCEVGQSDGGPGKWTQAPKRTQGIAYQERVTGAPRGIEYEVPANTPSGKILFDGYDPERKVLLDAKDWTKWPPLDEDFAVRSVLSEARKQAAVSRATHMPVEWHLPSAEKANQLATLFDQEGIREVKVVLTPKVGP